MKTFARIFGISVLGLGAIAINACSSEDDKPKAPGGLAPATGPRFDGTKSGTSVSELDACKKIGGAYQKVITRDNCVYTGNFECPSYIRIGQSPTLFCGQYDQGLVDYCADTYIPQLKCEQFGQNPCKLFINPVAGGEAVCKPTGGGGSGGAAGSSAGGSAGAPATGGSAGAPATGGSAGAPATGGSAGSSATGGAAGAPATGGAAGAPATGGAAGSPATGGAAGSPATGGASGSSGTGGASGSSATGGGGGSPATGGASGSTASAGAPGSGGAAGGLPVGGAGGGV